MSGFPVKPEVAYDFMQYCCGFKSLGVAEGEDVQEPYSPELRAVIRVFLGNETPQWHNTRGSRVQAFANLLRSVADALDPPGDSV